MKNLVILLLAVIAVSVIGFPFDKLPDSGANAPNPDESAAFFEGDLVLTPDQVMNPQNGILNAFYRWADNTIPYAISSSFNAAQVAIIKGAIDEIQVQTCLKFVVRTTQANYVEFKDENSGCWSYVGCVRGAQQINLQSNAGCVTKGVAMHEILHAVGFFHSQSDTSRDSYVKINYDNITPGKEHNFVMYTNSYVTAFNQEYDYNSILHYGAYAFTKNGMRTIETPSGQVIGQRSRLSDLDVKKVNLMYNCA